MLWAFAAMKRAQEMELLNRAREIEPLPPPLPPPQPPPPPPLPLLSSPSSTAAAAAAAAHRDGTPRYQRHHDGALGGAEGV